MIDIVLSMASIISFISFCICTVLFFLTFGKAYRYMNYMKENHSDTFNSYASSNFFLKSMDQFTYARFLMGKHYYKIDDGYIRSMGEWLRKLTIIYIVVFSFLLSSFLIMAFINGFVLR